MSRARPGTRPRVNAFRPGASKTWRSGGGTPAASERPSTRLISRAWRSGSHVSSRGTAPSPFHLSKNRRRLRAHRACQSSSREADPLPTWSTSTRSSKTMSRSLVQTVNARSTSSPLAISYSSSQAPSCRTRSTFMTHTTPPGGAENGGSDPT